MTFTIPSGVFDLYYDAVDFFINDNHIGKACTLIMPPKKTTCDNCVTNSFGGQSSNVYKHGGPAPFNFGNCPLCGGNGFKETEVKVPIRLRIYWSKKDWIRIVGNINVTDAEVMVIGFASDLTRFRQASEMLLVNEQTHLDLRFATISSPFPWGFGKNRYFVSYLKRV